MMPRRPLRRYARIPRRRAVPRTHKFTVRLTGQVLAALRYQCWIRDLCRCQECGAATHFQAFFDGDPLAYDMAHIQSRGAGGSDGLENVRTLCHRCHQKEHMEGRQKISTFPDSAEKSTLF